MKAHQLTTKNTFRYSLFSLVLIILFSSNPVNAQSNLSPDIEAEAQDKVIKGVVSNEDGVFPGVNIFLKGSRTGTVSDINGEFTFPKPLKKGDIILFTYIGYDTQEFIIEENTEFIRMVMSLDSIEIMESLNTNKPYKSKRKKRN